MTTENLNTIAKPIGNLSCQLAILEKVKGQRKLIEAEEREAKQPFLDAAGESACVWISESGQKLASVQWQSRDTFDIERFQTALVLAGVSLDVISKATVAATSKGKAFPVLRVH